VEKEKIPAFTSSDKTASIQFVNRLHDLGVLAIPSGAQKLRLLPPLILTREQAEEGVSVIRDLVQSLAA